MCTFGLSFFQYFFFFPLWMVYYSIVWTNLRFLIYSPVDVHLSCCQFLAVMNKTVWWFHTSLVKSYFHFSLLNMREWSSGSRGGGVFASVGNCTPHLQCGHSSAAPTDNVVLHTVEFSRWPRQRMFGAVGLWPDNAGCLTWRAPALSCAPLVAKDVHALSCAHWRPNSFFQELCAQVLC